MKVKVGLLPLYIKLYDEVVPEIRPRLEAFYDKIALMIEEKGIEVIKNPFCRVKKEFEEAVENFELNNADAIITLHMAYSPSLESIDALCKTDLPIVVLDTTETLEFTNQTNSGEIMFNHGIHGVMDLCSMFTRRAKPYAIAAGHYLESNVVDRVCGFARAAACASELKKSHVGLIGGAFEGMGDFRVSYEELFAKYNIKIEQMNSVKMKELYESLTREEIDAEIEKNKLIFNFGDNIIPEEYELSVKSCLALRKYVSLEKLTAFSVNFTQIGLDNCGLTSMPFIECCKAMENGIGYAGEGDALTAAFTGAFLSGYENSSFVEIFCPDWKNNLIFLSHMGEVNYKLSAFKPEVLRAGTNYSPGAFPYAGYTRMKSADGVYVNISRGANSYKMIISECELVDFDNDRFDGSIRGWMKPKGNSTAQFLEKLSKYGATHHSTFVADASCEQMTFFADLIGMEYKVI